ncbi:outer membrane protein assembly factor BamC [Aromatoleum anaerobium]|uniref:Outer membrane protein assembly factor BamC n=1 Tax=Aromatoleum anaerobium TaxID=182180 RepID=A0ABX1PHR3_9RHOO|nr:outer membrane protein assembly factor BamC [Aromatoleum anaerobium]MCK0508758.1 outer membrane protein assembly factor BamC [Aromatoleum anaerobium]
MNRSVRTSASLLALSLVLAGCSGSLVESKKIDYKSARQLPPLEIPPDLTAPTRDDRYAVPDVSPRGVATYSAYTSDRAAQPQATATADVLPAVQSMRVERAGTQRWLVVPGTPDVLWPQVKDFWLELGFVVNIDRPQVGVMETDWAEDRAKIPQDFLRSAIGGVLDGLFSTPERDKFRTRLEPGKEPNTVEIYISHRGMVEIYPTEGKDTTIWQPRPADPDIEAEMLRRLMVRLGAKEERAEAIVAAAPEAERATLQTAGGKASLSMQESFDRAWRRVGLALDRIGFTVEDRDRSKGLYFVRYVDPEVDIESKKSEGFLSKLAFWRGKDEVAASGSEYRLRVQGEKDASVITVMTREGGEDSSPTARKILALLKEQLR